MSRELLCFAEVVWQNISFKNISEFVVSYFTRVKDLNQYFCLSWECENLVHVVTLLGVLLMVELIFKSLQSPNEYIYNDVAIWRLYNKDDNVTSATVKQQKCFKFDHFHQYTNIYTKYKYEEHNSGFLSFNQKMFDYWILKPTSWK